MVFMLLTLVATAGSADPVAHRREIEDWQKARDTRLRADGGWLTLAGLFWLKPGANRFGTDARNEIVLPAETGPPFAGTFVLAQESGRVTVELAPGVSATVNAKPVSQAALRSDAGGADPDVLTMGALTMQVIDRHGRRAVRLKNANSKTRRDFKGLKYYPINAGARVVARFVPHARPVSLSVPTVLGFADSLPSPGTAEFELGGKTYRLEPVLEGPDDARLFFIFRDATAGKTTYGAGRFLYADLPKPGVSHIVLDFNKAYSPPCAFTPYATCPLPPPGNRLPVAIEAGELFERDH